MMALIARAICACSKSAESKVVRKTLTLEQIAQVRKLLEAKGLLTHEKSQLIGRQTTDEQTLFSLADASISRTDGMSFYYFRVWRSDKPLDYVGSADEGDGGVTIEVANGVIVKSSDIVAEF